MNATCQRTVNCVSGCVARADSRVVGLCANAVDSPYRARSLPGAFPRDCTESEEAMAGKEERQDGRGDRWGRSEKEKCEKD